VVISETVGGNKHREVIVKNFIKTYSSIDPILSVCNVEFFGIVFVAGCSSYNT